MFTLWELAKNHRIQGRLREQIKEKLREIRSKGRDDFTADDFDSIPYLTAVVQSSLFVDNGRPPLPLNTGNFEIQPDRGRNPPRTQ